MNYEVEESKMSSHGERLYSWDLKRVVDHLLALDKADGSNDAPKMRSLCLESIKRNEHLTEEQLIAKATLDFSDVSVEPDDIIAANVLLAETHPQLVQKQFWNLYKIKDASALFVYACFIQNAYSTARDLIFHVLQYGPSKNWIDQVAYSHELDNAIENLLFSNLSQDSIWEIDNLLQENPSCAMLKILKAFALLPSQNPNDSFSMEQLRDIFYILETALQEPLPAKYKYWVYSAFALECMDLSAFMTNAKMSIEDDKAVFIFGTWGLNVFLYLIFPNKALYKVISNCGSLPMGEKWQKYFLTDFPFTMHNVVEDLDTLIKINKDIHFSRKVDAGMDFARRVTESSGCCIWIIISLAGSTLIGGIFYWGVCIFI